MLLREGVVSWEQLPCRELGSEQRDLAQSDNAEALAEMSLAESVQEASQHHSAGVPQTALLEWLAVPCTLKGSTQPER